MTFSILEWLRYSNLTRYCIDAGPLSTHRLQEEISQLPWQTLYDASEMRLPTNKFWDLLSKITDMLRSKVSRDYIYFSKTVTN